jgi:hypothetical protein
MDGEVSVINQGPVGEDLGTAPETAGVEVQLRLGQSFFQEPNLSDSFVLKIDPYWKDSLLGVFPPKSCSLLSIEVGIQRLFLTKVLMFLFGVRPRQAKKGQTEEK